MKHKDFDSIVIGFGIGNLVSLAFNPNWWWNIGMMALVAGYIIYYRNDKDDTD